jgi:hypothetical protein
VAPPRRWALRALGGALLATAAVRPAVALDPAAPVDEAVHTDWPSVAHAASVYAVAPAPAGHCLLGT